MAFDILSFTSFCVTEIVEGMMGFNLNGNISYVANIMSADVLATQVARASADMVLTWFIWNILQPTGKELSLGIPQGGHENNIFYTKTIIIQPLLLQNIFILLILLIQYLI